MSLAGYGPGHHTPENIVCGKVSSTWHLSTYDGIYVELRNPQFEEIVSNFEITNTRLFSVAGRKFKSDRCRLTDKRFEALMFINYNQH